MPQIKEDGQLYNVGFLCRRDGTYEMYEKLHVTPDEMKMLGTERRQDRFAHSRRIARRSAY